PPPTSPLFPYTTLFRSIIAGGANLLSSSLPPSCLSSAIDPLPSSNHMQLGRSPDITDTAHVFPRQLQPAERAMPVTDRPNSPEVDRKSTRLNSSHSQIS